MQKLEYIDNFQNWESSSKIENLVSSLLSIFITVSLRVKKLIKHVLRSPAFHLKNLLFRGRNLQYICFHKTVEMVVDISNIL
jgi:hypothetical protein